MRPSTTEYDDDGTIHRTLSPAMRGRRARGDRVRR
jgi:hypothetical protein